jgi:hypothetical protein
MAEQHRCVEVEVSADGLDVSDLGFETHGFGRNSPRRFAASSLIVVDQAKLGGEEIQLRQEVAVVEIGAAVPDDHRRPCADVAPIELRPRRRDVTFADSWRVHHGRARG